MFHLLPHRDGPHHSIQVAAEAARTREGTFVLRYLVTGKIDLIEIPTADSYSARRDGLWEATCFEAFVAASTPGYVELNMAPSTAWAAYGFAGYRDGMEPLPLSSPHFDVDMTATRLEVTIAIDGVECAQLPAGALWKLGLSAVIKAKDGTRSYWALAHAPGPPDFHNPACFTATLPAAGVP